MDITISIPDQQVARGRTEFCAARPMPTMDDPENPGQRIPACTFEEHLREVIIDFLKRTCAAGRGRIAQQQEGIDIT